MLELNTVYPGDDYSTVLQAVGRDGLPVVNFFLTDTMTGAVWRDNDNVPIFAPECTWFMGLSDITVADGGSGYSATPNIIITGGAPDAIARAVVTNGVITDVIIVDPGDNYIAVPAITVVDGTGTGASLVGVPALGYQTGAVYVAMTHVQTALLEANGIFRLTIQVAHVTDDLQTFLITIIDCNVRTIDVPNNLVPSPPNLITYDFAEEYCSILGLTDNQRDLLPALVAGASMAVRRYCFDRNFDLRSYSEFHDVIQGQVRVLQPPVQQVMRVQGSPQTALTISNTSAQFAQAYFAYTGTWNGYGSNAQTATGIVLASTTNGTATSSTVSFVANQTIAALAVLINAVGSGWKAVADSVLGLWPVTELDGGYVGQGCGPNANPSSGAQFPILQDIAPNFFSLDTRRMGFLLVGRQSSYSIAGQWGPGGQELFGSSQSLSPSRVKVTYVGGESVIPPQVQTWTAELVKAYLAMAKVDPFLETETAQEYSYRLSLAMLKAMPDNVKEGLSPFRNWRA